MKKFYITTPIYYVNDKPHIGHAYTTILCDSFARFHRLRGTKVFYLTGTDEHGEKIANTAAGLGKSTQQHVDDMVAHFKEAWRRMHILNDDFIRTTEARHKEVVQKVIRQLLKTGDIYRGTYEGWYCVPCETFWTKTQLTGGVCPDCRREVKKIEEENYFFKMAQHQAWLINYINDNENFIIPYGKRQEVLSFLKEPLEDLCITRPRSRLPWGIAFPDDETFVVYVWFDALINYISAIGYGSDPKRFSSLWPADIHMIGKDILRQHAVYWPIMLKSIGIALPHHIIAHGWWTIEGSKVSKSKGNVVDPVNMSEVYGVDTFRYYMLQEATIGSDGAYSEQLLINRFNSDLADDLGNLVYRSVAMAEKYYKGIVPEVNVNSITYPIRTLVERLAVRIEKSMTEEFDPRTAVGAVWELIDAANKLVEDTKPWQLAKDSTRSNELRMFMYTLLEVIRCIGVALLPFLPDTADKILATLHVDRKDMAALSTWGLLEPGTHVEKGTPLFPKIEDI